MQGHWVLARAGKRVLRPGGLELTLQMLDALAIGLQDQVVEFAPGLGVTARMVLRKHPSAYYGVERDPAAAENLRRELAGTGAHIVPGLAEESDRCGSRSPTRVWGEVWDPRALLFTRRYFGPPASRNSSCDVEGDSCGSATASPASTDKAAGTERTESDVERPSANASASHSVCCRMRGFEGALALRFT